MAAAVSSRSISGSTFRMRRANASVGPAPDGSMSITEINATLAEIARLSPGEIAPYLEDQYASVLAAILPFDRHMAYLR